MPVTPKKKKRTTPRYFVHQNETNSNDGYKPERTVFVFPLGLRFVPDYPHLFNITVRLLCFAPSATPGGSGNPGDETFSEQKRIEKNGLDASFAGRRKGPPFIGDKELGGISSEKYVRYIVSLIVSVHFRP